MGGCLNQDLQDSGIFRIQGFSGLPLVYYQLPCVGSPYNFYPHKMSFSFINLPQLLLRGLLCSNTIVSVMVIDKIGSIALNSFGWVMQQGLLNRKRSLKRTTGMDTKWNKNLVIYRRYF